MLKDDNPDKGTETKACSLRITLKPLLLKDDNPDKGTETASSLGSPSGTLNVER